jgi:hypothetical protein
MHNLNAQTVAHRARFGRGLSLMASSVIALAVAPNVLAGFEYGIVTVNASASQLTGAGYTQVGTTFISQRAGDCFVNGCFTLVGASGVLPTRGFIAFQFEDFVNSPTYYNGMFSILDIDYGSTGLNRDAFIALINAQTSFTGVTAMTTGQANNAQGTCSFSEWRLRCTRAKRSRDSRPRWARGPPSALIDHRNDRNEFRPMERIPRPARFLVASAR